MTPSHATANRKGAVEALTGAGAGWVLSCEIKDGSADASAMGDGGGLRAFGIQRKAIGGLTRAREQIKEKKRLEVQCQSSAPQRETTNRPVRATASIRLSWRTRNRDCSAWPVRTPMCTGPQKRPNQECGWKRGGADSRNVAGQRQCPY